MSTQIQWSTTPVHRHGVIDRSRNVEIAVSCNESGRWYAVVRSSPRARAWTGYIGIHAPGYYDTPEAAAEAAELVVPLVEVLVGTTTDYMGALAGEGTDA